MAHICVTRYNPLVTTARQDGTHPLVVERLLGGELLCVGLALLAFDFLGLLGEHLVVLLEEDLGELAVLRLEALHLLPGDRENKFARKKMNFVLRFCVAMHFFFFFVSHRTVQLDPHKSVAGSVHVHAWCGVESRKRNGNYH